MGFWNLTNYVLRNNRFYLLRGRRRIGGRVPVVIDGQMALVGMVANPRAKRLFRTTV